MADCMTRARVENISTRFTVSNWQMRVEDQRFLVVPELARLALNPDAAYYYDQAPLPW